LRLRRTKLTALLTCTLLVSACSVGVQESIKEVNEIESSEPLQVKWPRLAIQRGGQVCEKTEKTTVECFGKMEIDEAAISQIKPVLLIDSGQHHTCMLEEGGTVYCWGANDVGQLGDPNETADWRVTPKPVPGIEEATFVWADGSGTCAIIRSSVIRCWGSIGDGSMQESTTPSDVAVLPGALSVYFGWKHACALHEGGDVYCWGSNTDYQLGTIQDALNYSKEPMKVPGISGAVYLAVGHHHSCALLMDQTVRCWGSAQYGQLGNGTFDTHGLPGMVVGLSKVVRLEVGDGHSCAVLEDATVWCWGWNEVGQLGDGTLNNREKPVKLTSVSGVGEITTGDADVCVKKTKGDIFCWGESYSPVPVKIS
jgi:alpha-tubulin suppressor-like RCC1 family protein